MKKLALFLCDDIIGVLLANEIIPQIVDLGLEPIIFNTTNKRNRKFKIPTPPLVTKFNSEILREVIIPHIELTKSIDSLKMSYRQLATKYKLKYEEIHDVNDPLLLSRIKTEQGLIGGISLRFLQVFEQPIIDAVKEYGFFWNLHSGLLPDYKGLLTPFHAIKNGETEYGLTLHDMIGGIDEGRIIAKAILPLKPHRPVLDLYLDSVPIAVEKTLCVLKDFSLGLPFDSQEQKISRIPNYYLNPTAEEFNEFAAKGIFFVDPINTTQRIANTFAKIGSNSNHELTQKLFYALGINSAPKITWESADVPFKQTDAPLYESSGNIALHKLTPA